MIIIEDFVKHLDEVLEFADSLPYYTCEEVPHAGRFKGLRTLNVADMSELTEDIYDAIGRRPMSLYFHKHDGDPDWEPIVHRDQYDHAGVIYLRGGKGCGTEVDGVVHEYKTGKLIQYNGNDLHRPEGFPIDRLVVTFFC